VVKKSLDCASLKAHCWQAFIHPPLHIEIGTAGVLLGRYR
jgi:hypothetical protein